MSFALKTREVGKVTVVQCNGRLIAGSAAESLRAHLTVTMKGQKYFALHLGELHFVDSSGLGMMVRLLTIIRRTQGDVKLCNVPETIQKLLVLTNLHKLFDIHETEESAISAFYRGATRPENAAASGPMVLCIDQSSDVLAYLRELLKHSGYEVHTSSNLPDALTLLRVMRPALLLRGPNLAGSLASREALEAACSRMVVMELGHEFSTLDAGQAGSNLLASIQERLQAKPVS